MVVAVVTRESINFEVICRQRRQTFDLRVKRGQKEVRSGKKILVSDSEDNFHIGLRLLYRGIAPKCCSNDSLVGVVDGLLVVVGVVDPSFESFLRSELRDNLLFRVTHVRRWTTPCRLSLGFGGLSVNCRIPVEKNNK